MCTGCRQWVALDAEHCGHCGKRLAMSQRKQVVLAVLGVGFGAAVLAAGAGNPKPPTAPVASTTASAAVNGEPTPEPAPVAEAPAREFPETFAEMLERSVPLMGDTTAAPSDGAIALGMWLGIRGRLADLKPAQNETTVKLAMKDSMRARGKRTCVRGTLLQLYRDNNYPVGELYTGTMTTGDYDVVSFIAAGDTGELVSGDRAKLCGVVTGRWSYPNAAAGTTHSIHIAGMFDLRQ